MHSVFSFIEYDRVLASEYFVSNLTNVVSGFFLRLCHSRFEIVERRQTMHEQAIRIFCCIHQFLCYLERSQKSNSFRNLSLFTHGSPNVSVDYICALQASRIRRDFDNRSGFLCNFLNLIDNILLQFSLEFVRTISYIVHAHLSASVHPCVAHVVSDISAEYNLYSVQRFCNMLFDSEQVSQDLSRVIHVSKTVPYRYAGIFCKTFYDFLIKASVLDTVIESAQYFCRIFHSFLFAHLRAAGIEECNASAFIHSGNFKSASGSGGRLLEQQNDVLSFEDLVADSGSLLRLQVVSQVKHVSDFFRSEIHKCQKASSL